MKRIDLVIIALALAGVLAISLAYAFGGDKKPCKHGAISSIGPVTIVNGKATGNTTAHTECVK